MAIIGNTVKLIVEFKTWEGQSGDAENITLKIYDYKNQQYGSDIPINNSHRRSVGVYEYEYLVPKDIPKLGIETLMYYEYSGIVEGSIETNRGYFKREWMKRH